MAKTLEKMPGYKLGNLSSGVRAKQALMQDLDKMKKGNLGASEAELQQASSQIQSGIGAQAGAQQAAIARAGLVGGQTNQGALHNTQQQIAQQATSAAAQANAQIRGEDMAAQQAESDIVRQRLNAQQDRRRQNAQNAVSQTLKGLGTVASVVSSASKMGG